MKKVLLIILQIVNILLLIAWIFKPHVASGLYCYPKIVDTMDKIVLVALGLALILTIILSITHSTKFYRNIAYTILILIYLIPTILIITKISIQNNNKIPFNEC